MYGWNESPTKAESNMVVNGESVYQVGKYDVTIHADGTVTYRDRYHHKSDPRETMPNMSVNDGEIRIPVTDLVPLVLSRLEPKDLALALWQNDEVKAAFMDCLVTRYNEGGIEDKERREFLLKVKEAVHSKALDTLTGHMRNIEYDLSKRAFFYHEVYRINDFLREHEVKDSAGNIIQMKHHDTDPYFKIGGRAWEDARDDWRATVERIFSAEAGGA